MPVTDEEKAFGILQKKQNNGIILRNWLTYLLRQCIAQEERKSFHSANYDPKIFKAKFNQTVRTEIRTKSIIYKNQGKLESFEKLITYKDIICKNGNQGYEIVLTL